MTGFGIVGLPTHEPAAAPTPNTVLARSIWFALGIALATGDGFCSVLKRSSPVPKMHRSPPSRPVGASHQPRIRAASCSSVDGQSPFLWVGRSRIRYQVARESLMPYSVQLGK